MTQPGGIMLALVLAALLIFGIIAPFDLIYPIQVLSLAGLVALQAVGLESPDRQHRSNLAGAGGLRRDRRLPLGHFAQTGTLAFRTRLYCWHCSGGLAGRGCGIFRPATARPISRHGDARLRRDRFWACLRTRIHRWSAGYVADTADFDLHTQTPLAAVQVSGDLGGYRNCRLCHS